MFFEVGGVDQKIVMKTILNEDAKAAREKCQHVSNMIPQNKPNLGLFWACCSPPPSFLLEL